MKSHSVEPKKAMTNDERRREAERRKEPRTPRKAVVIMAYGAGENLEFENAELTDCSPHGVGIMLNRPLVLGHHFLLKLKLDDRVTLVNYVVRNCTQVKGGYRVGGEFAELVGLPEEPDLEVLFQALLQS